MTWGTAAAANARTPVYVVEIDLDWYDDVTITATNPDGTLCYRTPATTDQGTFSVTTKTRKYQTKGVKPIADIGAIPCISSVRISEEQVTLKKGISNFGQVTVTLEDFVDDDRLEDPFYSHASRIYDHKSGTYLRKLFARNPYWTGRTMRVIEGFATNGVWDPTSVITRTYFIRDVQGPSAGQMTVTAAGPLQMLNLNKKVVPEASKGTLLASISDSDTSAQITPSSAASDYGSSGYARIGDEIVAYTRTGVNLTLTRAQYNTVAETHDDGDTIQNCVTYQDQEVVDVIYDLLNTQAGIEATYLDYATWQDEQDAWLAGYVIDDVVISEPEETLGVLQSLLETVACYMWWDDQSALLRFRSLRPAQASVASWTDASHLLAAPKISRDMRERASRTDVLMVVRKWEEDLDEDKNYRIRVVGNTEGEDETEHGSEQLSKIRTRWLSTQQTSIAARASYQRTDTYKNGRIAYDMTVSAKDATVKVGEIITLTTRDLTDRNGQDEAKTLLIVQRSVLSVGSKYRYKGIELPFSGRFAFMTDTTAGSNPFPNYDDATTDQRDPGAFMCNAEETIPDPVYVMG